MKTVAIVLVVVGILLLVYGGITYSKNRTVIDMGSLSVTAVEHKDIQVPIIVGVLSLICGGALLMAGKRRVLPV